MKKVLGGGFIFLGGIALICFCLLITSNMLFEGMRGRYNEILMYHFLIPISSGVILSIIGLSLIIVGIVKSDE